MSPIEFMLSQSDRPFRATSCWIVAGKTLGIEDWQLVLDEDEVPPETPAARLDDLKHRLLFDTEDAPILTLRSRTGKQASKKPDRARLMTAYLRAVTSRFPRQLKDQRTWVLMPAIQDDERRVRYRAALADAIPDVLTLPEPEMVVEYFRLVRRELQLQRGQNSVFLVIDAGASTCNMTFVISRRDAKVVEDSGYGRQRAQRVRAVRGDSASYGGRWVDRALASSLGINIENLPSPDQDELLRQIERAKVMVATNNSPSSITHEALLDSVTMTPAHVTHVGRELWARLVPLFEESCERLYEQVTESEYAQQLAGRIHEREITSARQAHKLLDGVIMAGGTSLLPGFSDALRTHLKNDYEELRYLHVGEDYPVAAAIGALAHVLHQHHSPSRLHFASSDNREPDTVEELAGALPFDIELAWKTMKSGAKEQRIIAIERDDPVVYTGGLKAIDGLPSLAPTARLDARLVPPKSLGKRYRENKGPVRLTVRRSPNLLKVKWDPGLAEARGEGDGISGAHELHLSVAPIAASAQRSRTPKVERMSVPPGQVGFEMASDVIIDLGMSKTVAVRAVRSGVLPIASFATPSLLPARTRAAKSAADGTGSEVRAPVPDVGPHVGALGLGPVGAVGSEVGTASTDVGVLSPDVGVPSPDVGVLGTDVGALGSDVSAGVGAVGPGVGVLGFDVRASSQGAPRFQVNASDSAVQAAPSPGGAADLVGAPDPPRPALPLIDQLVSYRNRAADSDTTKDLAALALALLVRPFVLLAGPPGCGKSTLARRAAQIFLGPNFSNEYREIHVQAHWTDDSPWFPDTGLLAVDVAAVPSRFFLFDECNLSRPEYYLTRFFRVLDQIESLHHYCSPLMAVGTLNVDETSRPPSPKVVDRCFLLELSAPGDVFTPAGWEQPTVTPPILAHLEHPRFPGAIPEHALQSVRRIVGALRAAVDSHGLRHDLLPSRRVQADVCKFLALHDACALESAGIMSVDEAIDIVLASRVLIKLAGAAEQIAPAIDALGEVFNKTSYTRCIRRLTLAKAQLPLGFVSPWQ